MKQSDLLRQAGLPQTERWLFNQASELRIAQVSGFRFSIGVMITI